MIGLFVTEVILFGIAALAGFAVGWRLRALATAPARQAAEKDLAAFRAALNEAQVRRASRP